MKRKVLIILLVTAALGIGGFYSWRHRDEQRRISAYVAALDRLSLVLEENAAKQVEERDAVELREAVAKCKRASSSFGNLSAEEMSAVLERHPELNRATRRVKRGMEAVQRTGLR